MKSEGEGDDLVVTELTYYDTQPYIYNGRELELPTLYYVSYTDPTIKVLDDPAVLAENMFDFYELVADADGNLQPPDRLPGAPRDAGEYYIRLLFEDETGADTGLKVNTSQRTVMFGVGTDYYDFYTAILPAGISGVSVTKVYDGTDEVTGATFTYTASPEEPPKGFLIGGSFAGKDQGEQKFTADDSNVMFFRTVNGSGTSATVSAHKIMLISEAITTAVPSASTAPIPRSRPTSSLWTTSHSWSRTARASNGAGRTPTIDRWNTATTTTIPRRRSRGRP